MSYIDTFKDTRDTDDVEAELQSLLVTLKDIVGGHARKIGRPVFELNEDEQQAEIDKLNPYVDFEFKQMPHLRDIPVTVSGDGLMFVSDKESGTVLGVERVSGGDVITGRLAEVCILPVPTVECILLGDGGDEVPIIDQVLSPVVLLNAATYKTGFRQIEQDFEAEHDLAIFQIGIPLEYYLRMRASR